MKEFKFKVGELVTIKDTGYCYSSYKTMFSKLDFRNKEENNSELKDIDAIARIFAVETHPDQIDNMYAVILPDGRELLMGERGLTSAKPTSIAVRLSDDYTAIVTKKHIKVGCQSVGKAKLLEIIEAAKKVELL